MVVVGCGCGVWVLDSVLDIVCGGLTVFSVGLFFVKSSAGVGVDAWLVFSGWVLFFFESWFGFPLFCFFVESLILAQDERWRRA